MVSNHPLVSIIIPNYNHARFLDERMTSVLEQTYQHIEVIILDDCSTDNSREVIEKYRSNPKVSKIVFNDTNSGSPFKQWYKGFQLCKGEIVWIAESDDSCEPTFLESLVPCFADEHVAFAFCRTTKVAWQLCHGRSRLHRTPSLSYLLGGQCQQCIDKEAYGTQYSSSLSGVQRQWRLDVLD